MELTNDSKQEDYVRTYEFDLPKEYGNLPQGMVWEKFLKLVAASLLLQGPFVGYAGTELRDGNEVMLKGFGGVGNEFHYRVAEVNPKIEIGALDNAVEKAINSMNNEKPGLLKRTVGSFLYRLS